MIAVNRPQSTINRLLLTLFGIAILIGAGKVTWTEFQSYLSLRSSQQWGQRPATFTKILKGADDSIIGAELPTALTEHCGPAINSTCEASLRLRS